jgi:hypothetical protein
MGGDRARSGWPLRSKASKTRPLRFLGRFQGPRKKYWGPPDAPRSQRFIGGGDFRIPNCHEIALESVCGAEFWCNRHCRTTPVVLEGFWGQVWPKIGRKPEKTGYQIANEPLSSANRVGFGDFRGPPESPRDPPRTRPKKPVLVGEAYFLQRLLAATRGHGCHQTL